MACSSRLRNSARALRRIEIPKMTKDRMGAGGCVITLGITSLNLEIGRVHHPRNELQGKAEKLSNINADEY